MALTPNVYLYFDVDNKRARVVDATNYSEEDIVLASQNAKGLGTVTSPTGDAIIVANTVLNPLVNLAVSTNGQWFDLPLDSNGAILNGTYSFTYSVRYAGSGSINSITAPSTSELEFFNAGAVLIAGDAITFSANTQVANNGVFTVNTISYNVDLDITSLTVTQTTLVNEPTPTGVYTYDVTRSNFASGVYTYSGCDAVIPKVEVTYDCYSTQFGQIIFKDATNLNGQTLVSRSLIGYYPNALTPPPPTESVTTSNPSLTFSELAVGTWTHKLTLNMTVTQSDGLVYAYSVVDTGETFVECVSNLCNITNCYQTLVSSYLASYQNGGANNLLPVITVVNGLVELANQYKICGETKKYADTVAQIESVLNASGECNCGCCEENKDIPYWVDNANLDAPSAFEQLQEQVDALELALETLEINVEAADEALQEQIDDLNLQVGALENAVQSNSEALLAYNQIVTDINAFIANVLALSNSLNTIQSQILALNPNSETFADDVAAIEALLVLFDGEVADLDAELQDIVDSIIDFNTDFPAYADYTVNLAIQYNAAANALSGLPTDIDALEVLLASLTPTTYAEDIDTINNQLSVLFDAVANLQAISNSILLSIQNILNNLFLLNDQVANLQEQINALPQTIVSSKIQPLYADVNVSSALITVLAQFMTKGGYVKFVIKGQDPTPSGTEISIIRVGLPSPNYVLYNKTVSGNTYEIDLLLTPDLSVLPINFKAGGMVDLDNVQEVISISGIDGITEIAYEQVAGFSIESNSISNVFTSIEVYGYDITFG